MPFTVVGRGIYNYNGVNYHAIECGGGGNCLFLSLSVLFRHYHIDDHATYVALRKTASDLLFDWDAGGAPGHIPTLVIPLSDMWEAIALADDGEYAGTDAVAAILEDELGKGHDIQVHILGPTINDVLVYRSAAAVAFAPTFEIHLLYIGFNHYRALVPAGQEGAFHPSMVISNRPVVATKSTAPAKKKKKVAASLKLSSDSSQANTSVSSTPTTRLELHHINVGQGESTLVLIRDAPSNAILRSILIDAGRSAANVTAYLDTLVATGDFKPIDTFFASHYDNDHIGGAAALLDSDYVDPDVVIYDGGNPPRKDLDFDAYTAANRAANRLVPPMGTPILDDFLGVTLRCMYMNGLLWKNDTYFAVERDDAMDDEELTFTGEEMLEASLYPKDKNNWSLGLVIELGNFTYFTAGDLSGNYEFNVAEQLNAERGFVSVMKAGHHGAGEATTGATLSLLRPRVVCISCGTDNDHGHPAQSCVDRLEDLSKCQIGGTPTTCTYLITNTVPPAHTVSQGKFPPGVVGANGRDGQGAIVITVTDVQARNAAHTFDVRTSVNPGEAFQCPDRSGDLSRPVVEYKDSKRRRTGVTEEQLQRRKEDRVKRTKSKYDAAEAWLLNRLEERIGKERLAVVKSDLRFDGDLKEAAKNLARGTEDSEDWPKAGAARFFLERWS